MAYCVHGIYDASLCAICRDRAGGAAVADPPPRSRLGFPRARPAPPPAVPPEGLKVDPLEPSIPVSLEIVPASGRPVAGGALSCRLCGRSFTWPPAKATHEKKCAKDRAAAGAAVAAYQVLPAPAPAQLAGTTPKREVGPEVIVARAALERLERALRDAAEAGAALRGVVGAAPW